MCRIEPTALSAGSVQREAREADPSYYAGGRHKGRSPNYFYPSFYENVDDYHYTNNVNPGASVVVDSNNADDKPVAGGLERNFFFNRRVTTVIFTSVVVSATTTTSIPSCSVAGTFAQCPQITAG